MLDWTDKPAPKALRLKALSGYGRLGRQSAQNKTGNAICGGIEIGFIQPLQARHRHNLGREIGVMLRGTPNQENQMCGVYRPDFPLRDPSVDDAHEVLNLGPNTRLKGRHENRGALQNFTGKDARRFWVFSSQFNFLRDIATQFLVRIAAFIQAINQIKPNIECMAQNGLIKRCFGFKVIVQIGLRHVRKLSDFFDRSTMEAIGGKNLLRGAKNFSFISDLDARALLFGHHRDLSHFLRAGHSRSHRVYFSGVLR
jgi:hypothetical protein